MTAPHDLHRLRRAAVNPYFSEQKITSLEPVIQRLIEKLGARISSLKGTRSPLPLRLAYECLSTDIITEYRMAKSYGNLGKPDFNPKYHEMVTKLGMVAYLSKQLLFIQPMIVMMPSWVVVALDPGMGAWVAFQEVRSGPERPL